MQSHNSSNTVQPSSRQPSQVRHKSLAGLRTSSAGGNYDLHGTIGLMRTVGVSAVGTSAARGKGESVIERVERSGHVAKQRSNIDAMVAAEAVAVQAIRET